MVPTVFANIIERRCSSFECRGSGDDDNTILERTQTFDRALIPPHRISIRDLSLWHLSGSDTVAFRVHWRGTAYLHGIIRSTACNFVPGVMAIIQANRWFCAARPRGHKQHL